MLAELPRPRKLRLVCRAGHGVTEPGAVVMAADELGAEVRLVAGRNAARFHPKLYLFEAPKRFVVLAGGGNLTAGGLPRGCDSAPPEGGTCHTRSRGGRAVSLHRYSHSPSAIEEIERVVGRRLPQPDYA